MRGQRTNKIFYNPTGICDRCNKEKLIQGKVYREYNKDGNWTGKWLCGKCWHKEKSAKNHEVFKLLAKHRTNKCDLDITNSRGSALEELTCIWRGVKNLNIENDNYNSPIDHSRDSELGIIQTKGGTYYLNGWRLNKLDRERNKPIDYIIFYCVDKNFRNIERIYIIPKSEIIGRQGITFVKDPSRGIPWYEKYRVKDEGTLKMVNDIWIDIINKKTKIRNKKTKIKDKNKNTKT